MTDVRPDALDTVVREVTVGAATGLHARPAALLVKAATVQPARVTLSRPGGTPVDCRSLLQVLALGVGHGETVVLTATGDGAREAVDALADLVVHDHDEAPA
jgi:phosphocarrier protein HPr